MVIKRFALDVSMMSVLSVSLIGALAGCQRQAPADAPAPVAATTAVAPASATAQAPAYQPPTAEQLFALVAPIALFPDRLVAQTLAASTHPDDVDAARDFLQQNRNLTGSALIDAADGQPWDPSVKSLVAFPAVLDQLANNTEWTAALGAAYASEPTDVMNAIQVMRGRARAHGNLQNSAQQVVQIDPRGPSDDETVAEDGGIVAAPAQTILIEPAESDVVYVPDYDPDAVYGEPIVTRVYSQGWYEAPPRQDDLVVTGLVSFGVGVLVGQLFSSHEHREPPRWGWNSWNTSWGGGRPGGPHYGRPAIVYDNHPYPVNRTTVINRTVNIDRSTHIDNRHDFNNRIDNRGRPAPIAAAPRPAQPDYAHMQRPNFTAGMTRPTAPNARPALPPPQAQRAQEQRGDGQRGDGRAPDFAQRPGNPADARGPNAGQSLRPGQIAGQPSRPGQTQPAQNAARNEPTRFDPRQQVAGQVPHVDPREQQRAAQAGHQDARPQQIAQPTRVDPRQQQLPQQRVDSREQDVERSRAEAQQRAAAAPRPQAIPQPQRPQQFERPPVQERPAPQRVEQQRPQPQHVEPQRIEQQRPQPQRAEPQREQQRAAPQRPEPQHENRAPAPKQAAPQRHDKKDDHGG